MQELKKLPDAEFELMRIIWKNPVPISTNQIIEHLDKGLSWKPQTVLTLLTRLIERGFLRSERRGKERIYYPLVGEAEYLAFESSQFMRRFHQGSFSHLVQTLYGGDKLSPADVDELKRLLQDQEES